MAGFHGRIGYAQSVESAPGVYTDEISERGYYGDVIREARQYNTTDQLNDNLVLSNRFSIVADDFASENFSTMRYVVHLGVYWKITNVEVQRPRLILSVGGVYNGPKA